MKSSIAHLPPIKQRELARVVEVLHEEFEDAMNGASAEFKKRGRILKIILFGSFSRGDWVDERHTTKRYRSDFDLLIIVNNRKLADFTEYWQKADDRLLHMREIETPVRFIVHSRREVNTALTLGQYFFVDIRRDGIVLYELDDEPLAEPKPRSRAEEYRIAKGYFEERFPSAVSFADTAVYLSDKRQYKHAAFELHQAIEQAYSTVLLTLTSYSPPSHNLKHLRSLAESQVPELAEVWPHGEHTAWFNTVNEAYVKARYSKHFEISREALMWVAARVEDLLGRIGVLCQAQLDRLKSQIAPDASPL